MNDDAALLRRYADEGSESAFAEVVRRHVDLVYGAAMRRTGGDPHRAADVAQQVFTTLARQARKLSRHAVLGA
jgi:DNA-directed RNA polymerase specialized sigma24 family protein